MSEGYVNVTTEIIELIAASETTHVLWRGKSLALGDPALPRPVAAKHLRGLINSRLKQIEGEK